MSKEAAQKMATDFYYWWHNQPGANTQQGFAEWWQQNMEAQPLALRLANDERNEHEERDDDH